MLVNVDEGMLVNVYERMLLTGASNGGSPEVVISVLTVSLLEVEESSLDTTIALIC